MTRIRVVATWLALPLGVSAPALADVVSFPAAPTVVLATESQSIAAGDLDGDLDIDLVTSPNFGTASYYLNDGTPTPFTSGRQLLDAARTANSVQLGDVNGDGRLDIVVGSFNGVEHLYLNNGTATPFNQVVPTDIGSDNDSTHVAYVVDLNGDGDLDVATANTNQQGNKLYFNNGTATPFTGVSAVFLSPDRFYSEAMAFGDVDRDGDVDVVVANDDNLPADVGLQLFLNNGSVNPFAGVAGQTLIATGSVHSVALGDVDGDADLDVVAGTLGTTARLLLNNGTNAPFANAEIQSVADVGVASYRRFIALTDMNADARLDLLVTSTESSGSTSRHIVVLNNGSARPFAERAGIRIGDSSPSSWFYAIADFDGDADKDVVIGGPGGSDRLYAATIGPDMVPPELAILSPTPGATLRGTVTVSATAIDDDGLESVSFQVLNINLGRRMAAPHEVAFDTTLVPNGQQAISAVARDRSGNEKLVSIVVTVANPIIQNLPPTVDAGADLFVALPAVTTLAGTASDDGMPANGTLTTTWSQVSGPGPAIFASTAALSTQLSLPVAGTYVFRLTVSDGQATEADEITVTVSAAPVVAHSSGGGGALGVIELLVALAILYRRRVAGRRVASSAPPASRARLTSPS